jgi:signal transduction histidine kinase
MRRRRTAIFFLILGICLVAVAVVLNVSWILLNVREVALLVFGVIFFAVIITGLVLNTTFLVREIRRSEQQNAFLNSVTHELKTPIASIKLYLETLRSREVSREKRLEFYDKMLADSDRLLHTVEQVLQESRTKDKKRQFNVSDINIGKLIGEVIASIAARHSFEDGVIRFTEPADEFHVLGDRNELTTVFNNLLGNAVKYSDDEPKISVRIRTLSRGNKFDIVIRDNGIGIPRSELSRIFKRFYRVAGQRVNERKGTGLGLSIVRSIVEKHGGKIWAESRGEDTGSTFYLRLPRLAAPAATRTDEDIDR